MEYFLFADWLIISLCTLAAGRCILDFVLESRRDFEERILARP